MAIGSYYDDEPDYDYFEDKRSSLGRTTRVYRSTRAQARKDPVAAAQQEVDALATALAERQARLERLRSFPDLDALEDGDVISFDATFISGTYSYAALRAKGKWYCTGKTNDLSGVKSATLLDFMISHDVEHVYVVTDWRPL